METFKTQAQIFSALLAGKKITHAGYTSGQFCYLDNGILKKYPGTSSHKHFSGNFSVPTDWSIYEEPVMVEQLVYQYRYMEHSGWNVSNVLMTEEDAEYVFKMKGKRYEIHAGPFRVKALNPSRSR